MAGSIAAIGAIIIIVIANSRRGSFNIAIPIAIKKDAIKKNGAAQKSQIVAKNNNGAPMNRPIAAGKNDLPTSFNPALAGPSPKKPNAIAIQNIAAASGGPAIISQNAAGANKNAAASK